MYGRPTFQTYYGEIERIVSAELDKQKQDYLLQVDPEEYLAYLISYVSWQPLEWDESQMTIERFSGKEDRYDRFDRRWVSVDAQRFRMRIPCAPHRQRADYLKLMPSSMRLDGEPEWKFEGNVLVLEVEATEEAVRSTLEKVKFWLGGRNEDIEKGNRELPQRVRSVWEVRRRRLEEQRGAADQVLQKLNISLYRDPNARVRPVEVKPRALSLPIERPKPKASAGLSLRREDVVALVDFIEQYARQFEVAPQTYARLVEEELRNLVVSMLNANYPGSATAETFNKLGKTDIRLRVDEGNVLIAECKMWSGVKAYTDGLDQLFGYLTWRQNYGVFMTFSKNKSLSAVVDQAREAIQGHSSFVAGSHVDHSPTRFSSRHRHPQDSAKLVEVFHVLIDLAV